MLQASFGPCDESPTATPSPIRSSRRESAQTSFPAQVERQRAGQSDPAHAGCYRRALAPATSHRRQRPHQSVATDVSRLKLHSQLSWKGNAPDKVIRLTPDATGGKALGGKFNLFHTPAEPRR